ncbi:SGNH/GDSL hydrolase family protein [Klebsiella pneumoniae]|uniref:SGNH/GDSL hydrolase family protein n=1 Tax=Klebsiella pneumoniae TaxID=573 RepID=UPI00350FAD1E
MAELNPPLGTTTPEIFLDNVKRADELVNGPAGTVNDRGGEPLDTWRQMMAKNDEIRQNLIPLSKQYATLAAAQADIANIPEGSATYVRSQDGSSLADEYINNAGTLEATGRKMPSQTTVGNIDGVSLKNTAQVDSISPGRTTGAIPVVPGIFQLSTGIPQQSSNRVVRTPGFIFLNAGDRITVPANFKVSGCLYYAAMDSAFSGEYFTYSIDYTATKESFVRLNIMYNGTDSGYNPKDSDIFDKVIILRNKKTALNNLEDSVIPSAKVNLGDYQTNYPIQPGSLNSATGVEIEPTSTFVQRTNFIKVDAGDTFSITDADYLYCPFFYNTVGTFISSPGTWVSSNVVTAAAGYVRFTTKRVDGGDDINSKTQASWIRGPNAISKWVPNFDNFPDGAIPLSKLETGTTVSSDFPLEDGSINQSNGANSGATATHVHRTGMHPIIVGDVFSLTDATYVYCPFFYNAAGNFISSDGKWHTENITSQVKGFVRFTTKRVDGGDDINNHPNATWLKISSSNPLVSESDQIGPDVVMESSLTPDLRGKINAGGYAQWAGKKWYTLGDSITARGWYQPLVEEITGISSFVNYGVGGTTIAKLNAADTTAMSVRWNTMGSDPDLITVWGGVNDFGYSYGSSGGTSLGVFADTDPLTFYGGLRTIIEGLTTKYPGVKLAFIVTTPVSNAMGMRSANAKGFYLADYCKAVREICEYYSIPYLDLQLKSGFNQQNINIMTSNIDGTASDGLHPSQLGMTQISTKIAAFLNSL